MWRFIVIIACKLANKLSKLTGHEGSVIGGNVARKLDKKILKKIRLPKYVIGITGSSGKSSSTELTYNILTKNGYKVVYNKEGSNTITNFFRQRGRTGWKAGVYTVNLTYQSD